MITQDRIVWYAEYRGVHGYAELSPADHGYIFTADGLDQPSIIRGTDPHLMRFGLAQLADAQHEIDVLKAALERAEREGAV